MKLKTAFAGLFLYLLIAAAVIPGFSREKEARLCAGKLEQSKKFYDKGYIDTSLAVLSFDFLDQCQDIEVIDIYRRLILIYLEKDDLDKARDNARNLLTYFPEFTPQSGDNIQFKNLIASVIPHQRSQTITSVSKKPERIEETPASVIVITQKEIRQRGYQDLVELLQDLPGFDISQSGGMYYSNIHQRGFLSLNSGRTLFLVDGIEENDLWTNVINLSGQFPMTNIKRVEIIYGPASSMYGANAFLGVINVITQDPIETAKGRPLSISGFAEGGEMNTYSGEAHVSGQRSNLSFSLTFRYSASDEYKYSGDPRHGFKPGDLGLYESQLSVSDTALINKLITDFSLDIPKDKNVDEGLVIIPGQGNLKAARRLDEEALAKKSEHYPAGFSNHSKAWYVYGKLKMGNALLGFQTWRKEEGRGFYGDGSKNGIAWIPGSTFMYLNYHWNFHRNWKWFVLANFKSHQLDEGSGVINYYGYFNGKLGLYDLLSETKPDWRKEYRHINSKQFRGELKSVYKFPQKPDFHIKDIVAGVEYRNSFIPGDYQKSSPPHKDASQDGRVSNNLPGGNYFAQLDLGAYSQVTFSISPKIKSIYGMRFDHNTVRNTEGYGPVFTQRAALVWNIRTWYLKLIFSQAFKAPSNREKFSATHDRKFINPYLNPEHVDNFEMVIDKKFREIGLFKFSGFYAKYNDIIRQVGAPYDGGYTNQYISQGETAIFGGHINGKLKLKKISLFANYTFTYALEIDEDSPENQVSERIEDIASHQFNLGASATFFKKIDINLRSNFVGEKETDAGATSSSNSAVKTNPYIIFHGAAAYHFSNYLSLSLKVNNIFDTHYHRPGIWAANIKPYPESFLQAGRAFYLRLSLSL